MRQIHVSKGIRVFDGVLASRDLGRLHTWAEGLNYRSVHHSRWRTVWRLSDGEPLRGPTWWADRTSRGCFRDDDHGGAAVEPDAQAAELEPLADALGEMLLTGGRAHARVSITPWIYPAGTGLGLHRDDQPFDGSYVFYFSPDWDVHWGGLLHCLTEGEQSSATPRAVLLAEDERASVARAVGGIWIAPVNNRLVVLEPDVRHFVSRVDAAAGDRPRLSFAGFVHGRA